MSARRKKKDAKKKAAKEVKATDGANVARDKMTAKERKQLILSEILKMKNNFLGVIGQIQDAVNTQYKNALQVMQNELFACEDVIETQKNEIIKLKNLLKKHNIKADK